MTRNPVSLVCVGVAYEGSIFTPRFGCCCQDPGKPFAAAGESLPPGRMDGHGSAPLWAPLKGSHGWVGLPPRDPTLSSPSPFSHPVCAGQQPKTGPHRPPKKVAGIRSCNTFRGSAQVGGGTGAAAVEAPAGLPVASPPFSCFVSFLIPVVAIQKRGMGWGGSLCPLSGSGLHPKGADRLFAAPQAERWAAEEPTQGPP